MKPWNDELAEENEKTICRLSYRYASELGIPDYFFFFDSGTPPEGFDSSMIVSSLSDANFSTVSSSPLQEDPDIKADGFRPMGSVPLLQVGTLFLARGLVASVL